MIKIDIWGGLLALLFLNIPLYAQNEYANGQVVDSESSEFILDALIYNLDNGLFSFTNEDGYYSCKATYGNRLIISALGYQNDTITYDTISFKTSLKRTINDVITIYGKRKYTDHPGSNQIILNQASIKNQTLLAGEADPIRALHFISGVTNTREGQAGLVVRGGLPDQNLIVIDGVRIYNYTHLFGFLSFINSNMVNDMTFYKSGVPTEFGGRTSSVLDINLLDGNLSQPNANISIGLLTSKIYYNQPIIKNKLTISSALRLSYFDIASIFQSNKTDNEQTKLGVSDGIIKLLYKSNNHSRFTFSYLTTKDRHQVRTNFGSEQLTTRREWKNEVVSLNFGKPIFHHSYLNIDGGFYAYNFLYGQNGITQGSNYISNGVSKIQEFSLGINFKTEYNDWNIKYGLQTYKTTLKPFKYLYIDKNLNFNEEIGKQKSTDVSLYTQIEKTIGHLGVNGGMRLSVITLQNHVSIIPSPRVNIKYKIGNLILGLGYDNNYQTNFQSYPIALGAPVEIWLNTDKVSISKQGTFSGTFQISESFSVSSSVYHKCINNLNDIGKIYQKFDEKLLQIQDGILNDGTINSSGLEIDFNHEIKTLKHNLAIGFQKSQTHFVELNKNTSFPTNFSRNFTLSYNLQYPLGNGWNLGFTGIYQTGQPITLPINSYFESYGSQYFIFGNRNNTRYPDYSRFDVLLKKDISKKSTWTFSIYNLANRRNPFHIVLESKTFDGVFQYSQYKDEVLFGILPTIAYEHKF